MKVIQYSRTYRFFHWAIAFTILFLLLTIFLRLTWMNKYNVAEIIESYTAKENIAISHDQAIVLAKKIRGAMWIWHIYAGYLLTALISMRFLLPLFGEMKFQNPMAGNLTLKERIQRWAYVVFYIGIVASLFTGLMMKFGPEEYEKSLESVHVLALYYLIPFLIIHITGVFIADFTVKKGIIYRIIRGGDLPPNT